MNRRAAVLSCAVLLATACQADPTGTVSPGTATTTPAAAETATWGQKYTWPDGNAVEVSTPTVCKAGQFALPQQIDRAVRMDVTITNGTGKELNVPLFLLNTKATFDSAPAEAVLDTNGPCKNHLSNQGTIQPGKTYKATLAYAVGKQPGNLEVTFSPNPTGGTGVFSGQA